MSDFKSLNLSTKILNALENKGYTNPTPIQLQAIPHILEGKDLLGIAQTGTGKTAAFSLPILDNLAKSNISVKTGCIRVLVLTPTRELASQISENIETYGKEFGLKHAVIFGGVSERPQITALQKGLDILVATPGRLLDLTSQGYVRYAQLETFVLDEADRMLDMGFINDVKKIIAKLPQKKQTLFFSATMPDVISELANSILKDPIKIEVTPVSSTVERIDQKVCFVDKSHKVLLLKKIIKQEEVTSVLVFSKTKHGANRVVEYLLQQGIKVAAIHGNKSQGAREKALSQFRSGELKVLVATDIAARGIDIPGISHVINYDIPMDPESYVHRIGRTARAGREGAAISFCDPSERKLLQAVEKLIKFKVPVDETHAYHNVESSTSETEFFEKSSKPNARRNIKPRRSSGTFSQARPRARSANSRNNLEGGRSGDNSQKRSDGPVRSFLGKIFGKFDKPDSQKRDSRKRSFDDANSGAAKFAGERKPRFSSNERSSFGGRSDRSNFSSASREGSRRSDSDSRFRSQNRDDDNFGNTERGSHSKRKSDGFSFSSNEGKKSSGFGGRSFGFGRSKPREDVFSSRSEGGFSRSSRSDSSFARPSGRDSASRKSSTSSRFGFSGGSSGRKPRSGGSSSINWKGNK